MFVSSYLMSEMQQTADHLLVIGRGRLLADAPIGEVIAGSSLGAVRVRVPAELAAETLQARLSAEQIEVRRTAPGEFLARGVTTRRIGDLAHQLGVRLHELRAMEATLEQAYLELTGDAVEYAAPARTHQDMEV